VIVSLVADRRTPCVAEVAHDLAVGLRHALRAQPIALYVDRVAQRSVKGLALELELQPLPVAVRAAVGGLRAGQHAMLAFVGAVTEPVLTAFDLSAQILVLTDAQVPSLRYAQRIFKLCRDVGIPAPRLRALVLADDPAGAEADTVRAALRGEPYLVIPAGAGDPEARRAACAEVAARVLRPLA
jgi:hypothetical protein